MLNRISQAVDKVLTEVSENYQLDVKAAFEIYKRPFNSYDMDLDIEHGFNQWLIHDYRNAKGETMAELILEDEMKDVLMNSIHSVFKVIFEKNKIVFKDLFTAVDYVIESSETFENNDLVSVRIYPVEGKYLVVDNPEFYGAELEMTIRQSIMNKYNEYCSSNAPMGIEDFIKDNSQLIYHLTNIIHYYENEMMEDDDMVVYVAEYAIKERELVLDMLLNTDHFQILETYEDEMTLVVLDDGVQIGEALVTSHKIELEAKSQTILDIGKSLIHKYAGDSAVFIKDLELGLDDLLE
ncbi:hypothetical protein EZV73_09200 [Acidaminobacter sp. JC074]|uniref:hypothetical protein n=1 Tax=Acidaminobacter sp. JC074 TaxID=2530199 RepID=UPI001F0DA496|nr:hypothetical protein [Acidaminobacter sp. JC074]MCH4887749.1 hypothetical protein [Acidaminobacter sp. JC074]